MTQRLPDSHELSDTELAEKITEPPMFRVLIHNDDFTTKAFVVEVLMTVFGKSIESATEIMWRAHRRGTAVCGVYALEVAETKINIVTTMAREAGFPLQLSMQED